MIRDPVNVLFADDDIDTRELVGIVLQNEDMNVVFANDGVQVFDVWRSNPVNLIILDIMMPVMDGLEACRRIRRVSDIPVILLTAKGSEQDIVTGFRTGADDYIVKPFHPRELVARIHAILNRTGREPLHVGRRLTYGNLVMDLDARRVTQKGRYVRVTPLEFQLLQYMMKNLGLVLTKEELLQNVWGYAKPGGNMNLVETTIRRLRLKVEPDPDHPRYIQTVWGTGYRFGE